MSDSDRERPTRVFFVDAVDRILAAAGSREEGIRDIVCTAAQLLANHAFRSYDDEWFTPGFGVAGHHLEALLTREVELCGNAALLASDGELDAGWSVLEGAVRCHRELTRVTDVVTTAENADDEERTLCAITPRADAVVTPMLDAATGTDPVTLSLAAARMHHRDDLDGDARCERIVLTARARQLRSPAVFFDEVEQRTRLIEECLALAATAARVTATCTADWNMDAIRGLERALRAATAATRPEAAAGGGAAA